jgi:hypothetical protein
LISKAEALRDALKLRKQMVTDRAATAEAATLEAQALTVIGEISSHVGGKEDAAVASISAAPGDQGPDGQARTSGIVKMIEKLKENPQTPT